MAGKIFINYRRDDSIAAAGRLHDRLARTFGRRNMFMDVDHIPAGADFVVHLQEQVAACDVFLAVIGPGWLAAADENGRRRLDKPDDFVVVEIASALARDIPVIPVLLDGARMPSDRDLPVALQPLARRNAVEVRNAQFGRDADALVEKIAPLLRSRNSGGRKWLVAATVIPIVLAAAWVFGDLAGRPISAPWRRGPETPTVIPADPPKPAVTNRPAEPQPPQPRVLEVPFKCDHDFNGAGTTFPYPIYAKWSEAFRKEAGCGLNYQAIGSGGAIKQIRAKTVVFGATDVPLSRKELDEAGLVQWPMVLGGVVPVVNIDGVSPGQLVLSGPLLARIFIGEITAWDDPAIKTLNPRLVLPKLPIVSVHRADGSGTTFIFTRYLSAVEETWQRVYGSGTTVIWPTGLAGKGNEGVASVVTGTKGAIGYVEYAYAKQNKLTSVSLVNRSGRTVAPGTDSMQAAASNANWTADAIHATIDTSGPGAWPITAPTYILVHRKSDDIAATATALKFFAWAYDKGGKMAEELDYVPLPAEIATRFKKTWAEIDAQR